MTPRPALLALALVSSLCGACRSPGLPADRGPPLVDDEPALSPPAVAPHGALRYSGSSRLRAEDGRAQRIEVPGRLESLVITLTDAGGRDRVKLVGTVHVAAPAGYAALRAELAGARVVLHEHLAGLHDSGALPTAAPRSDPGRGHGLSGLGLVDQARGLPPGARWRAADLTWEQARRRLEPLEAETGRSLLPDSERAPTAASVARPGGRRDAHELAMQLVHFTGFGDRPEPWPEDLGERDRARLLEEPPDGIRPEGFDPRDVVLLLARNDVVLEALGRELAKSAEGLIAVVYGAAHIRDIAYRSARRFGLRPGAETWHTVFDLRRRVPR